MNCVTANLKLGAATLLLLASSVLISTATAQAAEPSWFPAVSCKQAWGGRDKARFHFDGANRDANYSSYKNRLKSERVIPREACYKDWTVLVYMAADNDLSPYALWDLHEMEGAFASGNYAASTLKSDLLVEADTKGPSGIRRLHMFQTPQNYVAPTSKEQFVNASLDQVRSPVVRIISESGPRVDHQQKLEEFLSWGMKAYPAQHYAVIVWGHGQGWSSGTTAVGSESPTAKSRFVTENDVAISFADFDAFESVPNNEKKTASEFQGRFGGLAFNDSTGDYLSIPVLSKVLKSVQTFTLENERRIDLYASDACLMQATEVAYEISSSTRFISGSAQVQSFLGLPYRQLMYELNTGRFGEAKELVGNEDQAFLLARLLPSLTARSLDPIRGQQGRADKKGAETFTMSSLSTDALQSQLAPSLRYLGARLKAYLQEDPLRSGDLKFLIKKTPNFMGGARDLGSFLSLMRIQIEEEAKSRGELTHVARTLLEATDLTKGALQLTSVNYAYGSRYSSVEESLHLLGFKAIGIWLPQSRREFEERSPDFARSEFFKKNAEWAQWLSALYAN